MKCDVKLFIGNKELQFDEAPELLFTYQRTDVTNPTAIKNSFTKTITVKGTPQNNDVFGELYLLNRTQNVALFNPAKRVPFKLFSGGDLMEEGYAKLNNIKKTEYDVEYEITLFGGLGDFFYGLSYGFDYYNEFESNSETEETELKLKDLTYYSSSADDDTEFNFNITNEAVYDAWYLLASEEGDTMWNYINFAPAYNGLPDDFDADKVLINTSGYTAGCRLSIPSGATVDGTTYTGQTVAELASIPTTITVDGTQYSAVTGYALAELREAMTEWDIRDLRSYLQRPVLRVKGLINAICRYAKEQGGYTVNLDPDFFSSSNPYFEKAWITLPMLQNLNGEYAQQEVSGELYLGTWSETTGNTTNIGGGWRTDLITTYNIAGLPLVQGTYRGGSITINFGANATPTGNDTAYALYPSYSPSREITYSSTFNVQLVAYDVNNNIVSKSKNHVFLQGTEPTNDGGRQSQSTDIYHYGYFYNSTGATANANFGWVNNDGSSNAYTISLEDDTIEYATLKLVITRIIRYSTGFRNTYGANADYYHMLFNMQAPTTPWDMQRYELSMVKSSVLFKPDNDVMKSHQLITKKKLLSQDGTPCQYLISYCKLFNLYFDKDPDDKVINIRTRANYYSGNVIDLEQKIDRTNEINITPITAENKWYDFNYTQNDKCEFEDRYYNAWGTDFGKQKVKTEYNFDNSNKDLLEGGVYSNGLTALEKSKYFVCKTKDSKVIPSFMHEWSDFKLFNISGDSISTPDEFYIGQPAPDLMKSYSDKGSRYDFYPKLQLHSKDNEPIDGSNILVFYEGMAKTVTGGTKVYYNITDDNLVMYNLNSDQTCWLYTFTTMGYNDEVIAKRLFDDDDNPILPVFSRYIMSGDTITSTWDFGKCNEVYVPDVSYGNIPTIFDKYWYGYIADLYDVKTRVVKAYVNLEGKKVENELLKDFYYFDDSIWVLVKVEDYDPTSFNTTLCTFVKVNNPNNYIS